MSIRPEQPEPFLRGCVFPAVTNAPYPRADPAGAEYLPADVWDAAQLPVGVRLELTGNARTIRVWYRTTRASLGYRGESAGCSFVAYRAGQKVATVEAVMGEGMAELVMSGRTDLPVTVYLPEGMVPLVTGVAGVEEPMNPAPLQPRWLAYGDAVTQGWLASAPAMAWPAVAGRKLGLDVCNFGYAGTARGETISALLLAETPAEAVSIAFGLSNWSRVPHTTGLMAEEVRCFLSVVRQGHPDVPIVVVSPTARPDAEDTPNRVGATLAELRLAMEKTVLDTIADGDERLFLVEGLAVVDPEDLEDGMYPGDEGHRRLAAAVAKVLVPHLADLQTAADKRWANEGTPATPVASFTVSPPASARAPTPQAPTRPARTTPAPAAQDSALNLDIDDFGSLDSGSPNDGFDALSPETGSRPDMAALEDALLHHAPLNGAAIATPPTSADVEDPPDEMFPVDTGPVDTAPVDTAPLTDTVPVDTAPLTDTAPLIDTAPVDDTAPLIDAAPVELASPANPQGGHSLNDTSTNGTAPSNAEAETVPPTDVKPPVRRDMTPVDIEIADMVVAALTLATNGADDVMYERDIFTTNELQWPEGGEPVPHYELKWEEGTGPAASYELDWAEVAHPAPTEESPWSDPVATDGIEWADAGATEELQWSDPVPTDDIDWTVPGATEELQWAEPAEPGAY